MIFPHNIEGYLSSNKKVKAKDKIGVFLFVLGGVDVYIYYTFASFLKVEYNIPRFIVALILLVLNIIIIVLVFRFFVVKEEEQMKEFENSKDDSLAKYYRIREKEIPVLIDGVEVHENIDGNLFVCLQIFYGPNDEEKSEGTYKFFARLFNLLVGNCVDFRLYISREIFSQSEECKRFMSYKGNSQFPELSRAMMTIKDDILDFTETFGQLYSTYVLIRLTPIEARSIGGLKSQIEDLLNGQRSSIRNIEFLDKRRFRNFIRDYYNIEALDLSSLRNPNVAQKIMRMYGRDVFMYEEELFDFTKKGVKKK